MQRIQVFVQMNHALFLFQPGTWDPWLTGIGIAVPVVGHSKEMEPPCLSIQLFQLIIF